VTPPKELKPLTADQKALVEKHLRLAYWMAGRRKRHCPSDVDPEDIDSYAYQGLIYAATMYDPARETKFSTYAGYSIRWAITNGIEAERAQRGAHSRRSCLKGRPRRRIGVYSLDLHRGAFDPPEDASSPDYKDALRHSKWALMDPKSSWGTDRIEWAEVLDLVKAQLGPDRKWAILLARVIHDETLAVIGKRHKITKERARQIINRAADELRMLPVIQSLGRRFL
jgi:RNA polymerase sigma factor (sigma-70 family)